MAAPYFDWFEDLAIERKLERQVLLLALAHPRAGVESDRLRTILHRETTNPIAELVDVTWSLKHRGLLNIAPEPDDPNGGLCAYTLTAAGEVLAGEILEQARSCGRYWRQEQPDLPPTEEIDNTGGKGERTVAWHFHNLVTDSGSLAFATWRRGEHFVRLWSSEAAFHDVLAWKPRRLMSSDSVQELAGAWGPVGRRIRQYRIFPSPEA
ncbi:hypothetical protein V1460_25555 [Streptomyces sp. SCSIO 30461]|uniref:hypothetical protein n=1 Tax=Streptomyces sp. SCSIO 30461 TaxID=3118085 RepID=UPI0030CABF14